MFNNVLNKPLKMLNFDIEEKPLESVKEAFLKIS